MCVCVCVCIRLLVYVLLKIHLFTVIEVSLHFMLIPMSNL